jgi:hypothetical protein
MRFCITQRQRTFQCGVSMPLWKITRVKQFGPSFSTYEEAAAYRRRAITLRKP